MQAQYMCRNSVH